MTLSSPTNEHAFLLWKYIQNYINLEILCLYVYLLSLSLSLNVYLWISGLWLVFKYLCTPWFIVTNTHRWKDCLEDLVSTTSVMLLLFFIVLFMSDLKGSYPGRKSCFVFQALTLQDLISVSISSNSFIYCLNTPIHPYFTLSSMVGILFFKNFFPFFS